MTLEMDNSGAVDIAKSLNVRGRMHHVEVCDYFLRELKDQGLLIIRHIPGDINDSDIFTKNVTSVVFNKHRPLHMEQDEYVNVQR
jgi:hypothetical protein